MMRVGHRHIVLRREEGTTSKVVLLMSFGYPTAKDKEMGFIVRCVGCTVVDTGVGGGAED